MKTMHPIHLLIGLVFAGLIGCGEAPAPEPQTETAAAPDKPVPEVLDPSYDHVVAASGKLFARQIGVEDSVAVPSKTKVDIIDVGPAQPQVLVAGVVALHAQWKVSGFSAKPAYPASGFVTVKLARNQWKAIEGKRIVLRPSKE